MSKKKLNLAYITHDSSRKATFNKRKKGFFKKLNEISVLCGVEACAVVYNPYNLNPEVFPSTVGVKNVVDKFMMMPKNEQEKRMVDQESFIKQNITKIREKTKKTRRDNEEKTMQEAMFVLLRNEETLQLSNQNREDLCKYIDQYLRELYHHRETLNRSQFQYGESSSANNVVAPTSVFGIGSSSSSFPNSNAFNSSLPTNDLLSFGHLVQTPQQANAFSSNFGPSFVGQQQYYPIGVSNQNPHLSHPYQHQHDQLENSSAVQDGIYNPGQTQNQHYQFENSIALQDGIYYPGQTQNQHGQFENSIALQDGIYNPGQTQNSHQFGYPIVQDENYNPGQTENQQEGWLNRREEMNFLPMDGNNYNQFYHQP